MMKQSDDRVGTDRPPLPWHRRHRVPLLLGVSALLLNFYAMMWGLPNLWDVAADSVVPNGVLASRTRDFGRLTAYRYPPFHFDLLRIVFIPADAVSRAFFQNNPKLQATAYIWSARLVSSLMGAGIVLGVFFLTLRLFGQTSAVFASLLVALSPVTQYYSKNANLDVPYVFWLALTFLAISRFFAGKSSRCLIWAALAAVLAVCTKDQAYGCLVLFAVPAFMVIRHRRSNWRSAIQDRSLWLSLVAAGLAFVLIHRLPFDPKGFLRHVRVIVGPGSEGWREVTSGPVGQLRLLSESALRLTDAITPMGLALIVFGVGRAFAKRQGRWLLWSPLGYWLTFLAVIGYVYPRYTLPLIASLAPFFGFGTSRIWNWRPLGRPVGPVLAAIVLAWPALICGMVLYDMDFDTRRQAQYWIEEHIPANRRIGFLGDQRDMPRFNRAELIAERVRLVHGRYVLVDPYEDGKQAPDEPASARAFEPDVLVTSEERFGEMPPSPLNPSLWVLHHLGTWGRLPSTPMRHASDGGEAAYPGFRRAVVFRPRFGRYIPDVSPSFSRVISIYLPVEKP